MGKTKSNENYTKSTIAESLKIHVLLKTSITSDQKEVFSIKVSMTT